MPKPAVSIIIPTFNRGYIIPRAINSVLNQTRVDWELIIVDDGSTDDTHEVVQSFNDERIKYFAQPNAGPTIARNYGVAQATAKWVAYIDSDNELLPNYLEVMLNALERSPDSVFAVPRLNYLLELYEDGKLIKQIDVSDNIPKSATLSDIFMRTFHFDTNGLIHLKQVWDDGVTWDPAMTGMEDWDFALSIGEKYPNGFLFVPEVLANYWQRYGSDGLVGSHTYQEIADIFEKIYQKHKNDKLMANQTWYPSRVRKWENLQKQYDAGEIPPYTQYYFQ